MNLMKSVVLAAIDAALLIEPVFAGPAAPAPGPIAGVGLPAVILVGGAYWLGRKYLSRKK